MSNNTINLLLIVGVILVGYFLLIRPQQKRMRQHVELLNRLHHGDEVITQSGIYGTVTALEDDTVLIEISEGVEIRILKNSIARTIVASEEEPEEGEELAEGTEVKEEGPEEGAAAPETVEEEKAEAEAESGKDEAEAESVEATDTKAAKPSGKGRGKGKSKGEPEV